MIREPRTLTHTRADGSSFQRTYDCMVLSPAEVVARYGRTARRPVLEASDPGAHGVGACGPGAGGMPGPLLVGACVVAGVALGLLEGGD